MTSPSNGFYNNAGTSVGTSPTVIANVLSDGGGVLVQNNGTAAVYLGGPAVASSGASIGYMLAENTSVLVPSAGSADLALYAITGSSTATVVVLFPSGN